MVGKGKRKECGEEGAILPSLVWASLEEVAYTPWMGRALKVPSMGTLLGRVPILRTLEAML